MEKEKIKRGTGIFNYTENCVICDCFEDVDINGECEKCFKKYRKENGMLKMEKEKENKNNLQNKNKHYCPKCRRRTEFKYYDGCLGYESFRCIICDFDVNDVSISDLDNLYEILQDYKEIE